VELDAVLGDVVVAGMGVVVPTGSFFVGIGWPPSPQPELATATSSAATATHVILRITTTTL